MAKEIELVVTDIDRDVVISKLNGLKAKSIGSYHFKTINFQLGTVGDVDMPNNFKTVWLRVRTDGKRTTLTLKEQKGTSVSNRREYETNVDDFYTTIKILLKILPEVRYSYSESDRDEFELNGTKVVIDKRPRLPHSMEVEGPSEKHVRAIYQLLDIGKAPSKNIALPDEEYYKKFGIDYSDVKSEYKKKLDDILAKLEN